MAKRTIATFTLILACGAASAQQYGVQPIQPYQPLMQYRAPQTAAPMTYFGPQGRMTTITELPRSNYQQSRSFSVREYPGHSDGTHLGPRTRILTVPDSSQSRGWNW